MPAEPVGLAHTTRLLTIPDPTRESLHQHHIIENPQPADWNHTTGVIVVVAAIMLVEPVGLVHTIRLLTIPDPTRESRHQPRTTRTPPLAILNHTMGVIAVVEVIMLAERVESAHTTHRLSIPDPTLENPRRYLITESTRLLQRKNITITMSLSTRKVNQKDITTIMPANQKNITITMIPSTRPAQQKSTMHTIIHMNSRK